jgi:hypothetical protein
MIVSVEEPWERALKNYVPTMRMNCVRRYVVDTATTPVVSSLAIIIAGGGACTVVNNQARGIFMAVKINRIRIWVQPQTSTTATSAAYTDVRSITLSWGPIPPTNVFYGANRTQVTATAIGPEDPLFIESRPPRLSNAAGWMMGNTDIVFSIYGPPPAAGGAAGTVPPGTLIELDATYVLSDGWALGNPLPAFGGITAALGQLVYPALDNQSFSNCRPIGVGLAT